jgi:hypothetical protein
VEALISMALTFPVRPPVWQIHLSRLVFTAQAVLLGTSLMTGNWWYAVLALPPLLGAIASVSRPDSIPRATGRVLLALLLVGLLTALRGGYWVLLPLTVLLYLPIWLPLVGLGAFSAAVTIRHQRSRHLLDG